MQINPDYNTDAFTIRSYKAGEVIVYEPITRTKIDTQAEGLQQRINTTLIPLTSSFIITPGQLIKNWPVEAPSAITKNHFQTLLDLRPEIVILGTGNKIYFPASEDYVFLQQQGIGVEFMDTSAACRTYNFLVADGRQVAAALFMIESP